MPPLRIRREREKNTRTSNLRKCWKILIYSTYKLKYCILYTLDVIAKTFYPFRYVHRIKYTAIKCMCMDDWQRQKKKIYIKIHKIFPAPNRVGQI